MVLIRNFLTRGMVLKISRWSRPSCIERAMCNVKSSEQKTSTVDAEEVTRFDALSSQWWREGGDFKALHSMNALRVPLVRDGLVRKLGTRGPEKQSKPLAGFDILDAGCGGGILTEPLSRLGGSVCGVDASAEAVEVARQHARNQRLNIAYTRGTVSDLQGGPQYDCVVASEVVEHVDNVDSFVAQCAHLIKPGGSFFLTTINKTWLSYVLGIRVAENCLRIVPPGTHDWEKFISPEKLEDLLRKDFRVVLLHGMTYNPLTNKWHWIKDTNINYALHAIKN